MRGLALIGLLILLSGRGAISQLPTHLLTRDINRDGRPDVWQYYDSRGVLLRVNVDTNFDGRSDVQELYENGHLIRRESDRNFDDRVDLVEEFDAITGQHTRSVVDADFDGRADLIVLFSNGTPVFSQWTPSEVHVAILNSSGSSAPDRHSDDSLRTLDDPFSTACHFRADTHHAAAFDGWMESRSTPARFQVLDMGRQGAAIFAEASAFPVSVVTCAQKPRGPPNPTVPL
jgi:hypothetical protein